LYTHHHSPLNKVEGSYSILQSGLEIVLFWQVHWHWGTCVKRAEKSSFGQESVAAVEETRPEHRLETYGKFFVFSTVLSH